MCDGDVEAGLELAVGAAAPESEEERRRREAVVESLADDQPTAQQLAEFERAEEEREERIAESPIVTSAERFLLLAREWVNSRGECTALGG